MSKKNGLKDLRDYWVVFNEFGYFGISRDVFEFFDFGHSKPLFQLQNELSPRFVDQMVTNQWKSFVRHCVFGTDENLLLGVYEASEKMYNILKR